MRTRHLTSLSSLADLARAWLRAGLLQSTKALASLRPTPRAARRDWTRRLEVMGRTAVREALASVELMHVGNRDVVRFVDAGVTFGRHRFPTRAFVERWLGEAPEDKAAGEAIWRFRLALIAVIALISGGVPLLA